MTRKERKPRPLHHHKRTTAARIEEFLYDSGILGHATYRARVPWRV